MKVCKSQLETLLEWDQLCSSCQEALSSEDTEVISFCVFHFIDGCIYLGGYEQVCPVAVRTTRPRRSSFCIAAKSFDFGKTASSQADKTVAVQQGRAVNLSLQDLCFPPLGICLHWCLLWIPRIYHSWVGFSFSFSFSETCDISRSSVEFGISHKLKMPWRLCKTSTLLSTKPSYLKVKSWYQFSMTRKKVRIPLLIYSPDVLIELVRIGCSLIKSSFYDHLSRIPNNLFRHSLETSFSFMEIIAGCITDPSKKNTCLSCLLEDWYAFSVHSLVDQEYEEINTLFNQLSTQVLIESMCNN